MDNRKKNGGARNGSGRKPKATEIELIELLTPLDALALKALKKGVTAGEFPYVKLFLEYRYGKPKQIMDITTNGESIQYDDSDAKFMKLTEAERMAEIKRIMDKLESEI